MLAGDTSRSAADAGIAMAGITLLSRKGYFRQRLDDSGRQYEESVKWSVHDYLLPMDTEAVVEIEDHQVKVRAWRYDIIGCRGHIVPVYLLDTDVEGNSDYDLSLTDHLYGGDVYYRLCQEVILGIRGIRVLRALDYTNIARYHMNEGHSSLLVCELMAELSVNDSGKYSSDKYLEKVRRQCVFTNHTPDTTVTTSHEADIPYSRLENIIIPVYYHNRDAYVAIMRNAVAINGSFLNTEPMISQYVTKAYFR